MFTQIITLTDGSTIEATHVAIGQKNVSYTAVDGTKGTLSFDDCKGVNDSRWNDLMG